MTTTADLPDIQATKGEELAPAPEPPQNYASRTDVRDNVIGVVKDIMTVQSAYMLPLWKRWRLTYYMLAGNTIDRAGPMEVHVPELYKMVETIVPRAMDALLGRDPWFRLNPGSEEDIPFVDSMAALQDYQTRQAGIIEQGEEAFRNLLITQSCAFQVEWRDERRKIKRQLRDANGKIVKTIEKVEKVYVGPSAKLIDPFDFIIDPRCTDEQKGLYTGHRCMMTAEQIGQLPFMRDEDGNLTPHAKATLGRLAKQSDGGNATRSLGTNADWFKVERSPTERLYGNWRSPLSPATRKSPPQYEVIQLAMPLNLLDDGVFDECIVIVAGGTEVLLACYNPYLYKHRPYITARAAKNAHSFFGVGPLDNAVRLNQMLDRYHAIYMRMAEVTASPFWWVENEGADIPTSLYHTRPGRVVAGAGRVTPMALPTEGLRSGPMVMSMITQNIEETVGAYKIQMGQDTGGTATEALTALQEGNRRLKGIQVNFAGIFTKWLSIGWKLNAQFMTEPDSFQVIGKRSKDLNARVLSVGPDIFLNEPYYEIVGIDGLDTYGMRATALAQASQIMMPLLLPHAGSSFNDLELANEYFASVTDQPTADRIIKVRPNRETLWSQEEENHKLLLGEHVAVSPDDPDDLHLEKMLPVLQHYKSLIAQGKKFDFTVWAALAEHANKHIVQKQRKQEEKAVQAQIRPPALPPQAGGTPSADGQPGAPQVGGFPAQLTNPPGESPGPMSQGVVGRFGREPSPLAQAQAQAP